MRAKMRISIGILVVITLGAIGIVGAVSGPLHAGPQADGKSGVTTNGWLVTPAGQQVTLGDRPYGLAVSPDGKTMVVTNNGQSTQSLQVVDLASGKVVQTIPYTTPESLFIGVAFSPSGKKLFASAGGNNKIRVFDVTGQHLEELVSISLPTTGADGKTINHYPAGLTVSPDGKMLYAAANMSDSLAMIDLATGKVTTVSAGHNPYTTATTSDGKKVYVSNWGSNTLSVIDPAGAKVLSTITVGQHPNALTWAPGGKQLFVANGDSDTISVVDPATDKVTATIDLAPYPNAKQGANPNALAVSADGKTLYVANALDNDVAVVDLSTNKLLGLVPTGWYPTGVALQGDNLYVLNAKGLGAGPNNNPGPSPYRATTPPNQYVGSMIPGTLSIIPKPGADQLSKYTDQVWSNNDFAAGSQVRGTDTPQQVIPHRVGDPSPIKHVIYIVKENRTYDQVFGDLGKGAGDPSLTLFNDDSAPNIRALARQYVTLDNFYANAEVSADGWNWSTAAEANTYVQKTWPANYSSRNRPYDFEGGNPATAPNRRADQSYLWNLLDAANVNYRNYGFWANGTAPYSIAPTEPGLAAHSDTNYPGYNLDITDQTRVEEWLKEFKAYEAGGTLPTFEFVRLPNDHTSGTSIGKPTPKAMVADNDMAVGRLVEAVSSSKFWADTAIFIVEDDAQNGPDHIDAHRTEALVVSPYTQTAQVDSTFYSTASMLRTMELIVGIAPLTQFDTAAMPMARSFTSKPNPSSFKAITPKQPLTETNTALSPMALVSASQDLSVEDRINEQAFNEAIWASVKGASVPMPAPQHNLGMPTQTTGTDADG